MTALSIQGLITAYVVLFILSIGNIMLLVYTAHMTVKLNQLIDDHNDLLDATCAVEVIGNYKTDPYGDQ